MCIHFNGDHGAHSKYGHRILLRIGSFQGKNLWEMGSLFRQDPGWGLWNPSALSGKQLCCPFGIK